LSENQWFSKIEYEKFSKNSFLFYLFSLIFSCEKSKDNAVKNGEEITILIQPFEDVKPKQLAEISENIRKIYPKIKILEPINFQKILIINQEIDIEQILLLNI
jgi:archaemetzincin